MGAGGAGGAGGNSTALPADMAYKQNELHRLDFTADNKQSVFQVGRTIIVQNKDKQMSIEKELKHCVNS